MKIVVIGGGPAGMMTAILCAEKGNDVTLIEKNEKLGKKLFITGKGRCNITNDVDEKEFLTNVISNPKFMISALSKFNCQSTMEFLQTNGLILKTERGNRVFPITDKSSDVIFVFEKMLKKLNVNILLKTKVTAVIKASNNIDFIETSNGNIFGDIFVFATGGLSYSKTGSDGDGYKFAKSIGHTLVAPVASLCSIRLSKVTNVYNSQISFLDMPSIEGLSLKNVNAKIINKDSKKILFDKFGEMVFTSDGVSGPIILTLSSLINRMTMSNIKLVIDLKPSIDEETLDKRLLKEFSNAINKDFKNIMGTLLPSSMIPYIIKLSGISESKKVNIISKEERLNLCKLLKNLTFDILGLENIDRAIVTAGGVNVKEIDPKTMKSKLINNLYIIGELLDIDALTGGFNIQVALTTAECAARSINSEIPST